MKKLLTMLYTIIYMVCPFLSRAQEPQGPKMYRYYYSPTQYEVLKSQSGRLPCFIFNKPYTEAISFESKSKPSFEDATLVAEAPLDSARVGLISEWQWTIPFSDIGLSMFEFEHDSLSPMSSYGYVAEDFSVYYSEQDKVISVNWKGEDKLSVNEITDLVAMHSKGCLVLELEKTSVEIPACGNPLDMAASIYYTFKPRFRK